MTKPVKTDQGHRTLLEKLRTAFDDYLVAEVNRFGGIPRKLSQQMVFENAVAELLEAEEAAALLTAPPAEALEIISAVYVKGYGRGLDQTPLTAATNGDRDYLKSFAAKLTAPGGVPPSVEAAIRELVRDIDKTIGDSNAYRCEPLIRAWMQKLSEGGVPPWGTCDCGEKLTMCVSCAVSDYQAAHPECSTCCPAPPGTPSPEARTCVKHGPLVGVRYCPECASSPVGSTQLAEGSPFAVWRNDRGYRCSECDRIFPCAVHPVIPVGSTEDEQDTAGLPGTTGLKSCGEGAPRRKD